MVAMDMTVFALHPEAAFQFGTLTFRCNANAASSKVYGSRFGGRARPATAANEVSEQLPTNMDWDRGEFPQTSNSAAGYA